MRDSLSRTPMSVIPNGERTSRPSSAHASTVAVSAK